MPALDNDRHEKFVQEVFSGKTATAAYQAALLGVRYFGFR
jgi:hypothetical protein